MPQKGTFTQCVCVLLNREVTIDQIEESLSEFQMQGRHESVSSWHFSGPSVTLPFRPEVNGYVAVDVVNHRWPDHMGDPKSESELFGAWGTGNFGPFAWPGGLKRAAQGAEVFGRRQGELGVFLG